MLPNDSCRFDSCYTTNKKYFRVRYNLIAINSKKLVKYDYRIELTTVPSNLQHGEILYFVCPTTGRRVRILYWNRQYGIWTSRFAFDRTLYYRSQLSNKSCYHEERYWYLEQKIARLKQQAKKVHYKGRPTRLLERIKNLESRKMRHEFYILMDSLNVCNKLEYSIFHNVGINSKFNSQINTLWNYWSLRKDISLIVH